MKQSDTELISAFLDGELSDNERKQFEQRLSEDQDFATNFANFSENDQALLAAYSKIDDTPIPSAILDILAEPAQSNDVPQNNERQDNVVELSSWRQSKWLAVAASFLVIALALPLLMTKNEQSLADVLDSEVSGQTVVINSSTSVELVMSFSDSQGQFCREYVTTEAAKKMQHQIACKLNGRWQTQVSEAYTPSNSANYRAASELSSAKIEAWLDANMSGIPMSQENERLNLSQAEN